MSRLLELQDWAQNCLKTRAELQPITPNASFRNYWRIRAKDRSWVVMDSPPDKENNQPFIAVARIFKKINLCVPEIYETDLTRGFLLLSDLGDRLYLDELTQQNPEKLYSMAMHALLKLQTGQSNNDYQFPHFDEKLYRAEMQLFRDWYLEKLLGIQLSSAENKALDDIFNLLVEDALAQPQCCVHRDYHSRNLMFIDDFEPGILDFQDALIGPITYDLLSLLRDCYIDWPPEQVAQWVTQFQQALLKNNLLAVEDPQVFMRWFDWIGLQRNLKCIGIFSRLKIRDQKANYLQYIPRVIHYARYVCRRYPEFSALEQIFSRINA